MKFGKTLKKVSESDHEYGTLYLRYKLLRKFLKQEAGDEQAHVLFMQMLEKEYSRISKLVEIKWVSHSVVDWYPKSEGEWSFSAFQDACINGR